MKFKTPSRQSNELSAGLFVLPLLIAALKDMLQEPCTIKLKPVLNLTVFIFIMGVLVVLHDFWLVKVFQFEIPVLSNDHTQAAGLLRINSRPNITSLAAAQFV